MINRSRRPSLSSRSLLSLLALAMLLGPLGCATAKPREHWWQFWRPKAAAIGVFKPDTVVLPPPPETVGAGAGGGAVGTLPPPPVVGAGGAGTEGSMPRTGTAGQVSELRTVHFDYDSADLGPEAMRELDSNAQWLLQHPGIQILIEGHCDERGSVEYNLNLGDRRAKAVRAYLIQKGVVGDVLHTMTYGKERPIDPSTNDAAYSKNRRAQFFAY